MLAFVDFKVGMDLQVVVFDHQYRKCLEPRGVLRAVAQADSAKQVDAFSCYFSGADVLPTVPSDVLGLA
jgi:hypothetical protein